MQICNMSHYNGLQFFFLTGVIFRHPWVYLRHRVIVDFRLQGMDLFQTLSIGYISDSMYMYDCMGLFQSLSVGRFETLVLQNFWVKTQQWVCFQTRMHLSQTLWVIWVGFPDCASLPYTLKCVYPRHFGACIRTLTSQLLCKSQT
jgi:hypothetical protein